MQIMQQIMYLIVPDEACAVALRLVRRQRLPRLHKREQHLHARKSCIEYNTVLFLHLCHTRPVPMSYV